MKPPRWNTTWSLDINFENISGLLSANSKMVSANFSLQSISSGNNSWTDLGGFHSLKLRSLCKMSLTSVRESRSRECVPYWINSLRTIVTFSSVRFFGRSFGRFLLFTDPLLDSLSWHLLIVFGPSISCLPKVLLNQCCTLNRREGVHPKSFSIEGGVCV